MSALAVQLHSSAKTGGKNEWNTPRVVLDGVRRVAAIAFDPCPGVGDLVAAETRAGADEDGLGIDWGERSGGGLVYCNPPYSECSRWAVKIAMEAALSTRIIVLVAARTDTRWWRVLWDASDAVGLWRGRLTFGDAKSPAPFPSALFGLNVSQRRFRQAFSAVAEVVVPC